MVRKPLFIILLSLGILFSGLTWAVGVSAEVQNPWFEVQVVDSATGKGIPGVELVRNGLVRLVTDSAGRVAIIEPDFMNQRVYFDVKIDCYDPASNNTMSPGVVLNVVPGGKATIKLKRNMIAEPGYRITGSGIFKDSGILGLPVPVENPYSSGGVVNKVNFFEGRMPRRIFCISPQSVVYKGKLYWFYNGLLGTSFSQKNYRMAVATTELPGSGKGDIDKAIDLDFILDNSGFPKEMAPFGSPDDIVWFDSVMTVKDASGNERLVAHYIIYNTNSVKQEHGLAVYNDNKKLFEKLKEFDKNEDWAFPQGRNFKQVENGVEYIYFGNIFPNVRVPATFEAIQDSSEYEAWSCYAENDTSKVLRNKKGELVYRWTKNAPPLGSDEEKSMIRRNLIKESEALFLPKDEQGNEIAFQSGTVRWNPYRKKWIFIGTQYLGQPSRYGEVWYSEAFRPTGPWEKAVKIVTTDNYTLLNPVHHDILDADGGRVIYFEGTYTADFITNALPKMMYNNNQLMFRLQLDDSRIISPFAGLKDKTPPVPDTPPDDETPIPTETPGKTPGDETPVDKTPGDETPVDETPSQPETPQEPGSPKEEPPIGTEAPQEETLPETDIPTGGDKDNGDETEIPVTGNRIRGSIFILAALSLLSMTGVYIVYVRRRRAFNQ